MSVRKLLQQVVWTIIIVFVLTGCGAPAVTPTPEPSPEPVVEAGEGIFDGKECTVSVPNELSPRRYSFVLKDLSEDEVNIFVSRHVSGTTFQDLLDLQGEPGGYIPEPVYDELFTDAVEQGFAHHKPDGGEVHTFILTEEGEYVVGLWSWETADNPMKIWFCAPFWVKKAPSE